MPTLPRERHGDSGQTWLTDDPHLSDTKVHNYHHGAQLIGDFYEEATYQLFKATGAKRLTTGGDVCPDLQESTRGEFFIESKAGGPGGRVFVFQLASFRAYKLLVTSPFPRLTFKDPDWEPVFLFALWVHGLKKVKGIWYRDELREKLAENTECVYLVDIDIVEKMMVTRRVEVQENWEAGYRKEFVRVNMSAFKGLRESADKFANRWDLHLNGRVYGQAKARRLKVYGHGMKPVPTYWLLDEKTRAKPKVQEFLARFSP